MANIRSAYAKVMNEYLTDANKDYSATVTMKQTKDKWQTTDGVIAGLSVTDMEVSAKADVIVGISADGKAYISDKEISGTSVTGKTPD